MPDVQGPTSTTSPAASPPPPAPSAGTSAPQGQGGGPTRGSAIWFGVALVLIGGAVLLEQFVPGLQLWRLWPLIIIALGVRQMFGPGRGGWTVKHLAEGVTTVVFGLVFLGCSIGFLSWNAWFNIFRLWPVLVIALGIEVIGHGLRSPWVRAVSSLLVALGLLYGALLMPSDTRFTWPPVIDNVGEAEPFSHSAPHSVSVRSGTAMIDGGVGEFSVVAGEQLATAEGSSPFQTEFVTNVIDDVADVRIGYASTSFSGPTTGSNMDITLDRDVVWDLDVSAGVSSYRLDLSDLPVSEFRLDAGVSDGTVILGPSNLAGVSGALPVSIQAGVSSLVVRVPSGDGARVVVRHGLSDIDAEGTWVTMRGDGRTTFESDGFDGTGPYWDIEIEAGVGAIRLEYY